MKLTRLLAGLVGAALAASGLGCDRLPAAPPPGQAPSASAGAGSTDPLLTQVLRDPDPYQRIARLAELLPTLGPEAIPLVQEQLLRNRATLGGAESDLLVRFWASRDPAAATAWAFGQIAPSLRLVAVQTAAEEWAKVDPMAALEGIAKQMRRDLDSESIWSARVALMRGWPAKDRARLEGYIHGLGVTREREDWALAYALAIAQTDGPDALMRWAEALPADDKGFKKSVYHHVATLLAGFDPAAARSWCDKHCDGPYAVGMRSAIVLTQLRDGEDPKMLLEWVARAPQHPENDQLLPAAYGMWARRDPDAALPWMSERLAKQDPPWVTKLLAPYARNLAVRSPAEAIRWAERVEPPEAREALLVEIARDWRQKDEAAAEAWLASSPLSESARESARKSVAPAAAAPVPPAPSDGT